MKRFIASLALASILTAQAAHAQNTSLRAILTAKTTCSWPSTGSLFDFDPSVLSTMKQDTAGTTAVAANNDPIGKWVSNDAGAFTVLANDGAGTFPLWKTSNGLTWAEGDGTNDILYNSAAAAGVYAAGAATLAISMRVNSNAAYMQPFGEGNSSGNTSDIYTLISSDTPTPDNDTTMKASGSFPVNAVTFSNVFTAGVDKTVIAVDTGTEIRVYVDGYADRSPTTYTRGTATFDRAALFGSRRASPSQNYFNGRIYRIRAFNFAFSPAQVKAATVCLKATQGR